MTGLVVMETLLEALGDGPASEGLHGTEVVTHWSGVAEEVHLTPLEAPKLVQLNTHNIYVILYETYKNISGAGFEPAT